MRGGVGKRSCNSVGREAVESTPLQTTPLILIMLHCFIVPQICYGGLLILI
jgi:hypothetical protein